MGKVLIEGKVVIIAGPKSTGKKRLGEKLADCYTDGKSSIIRFQHVRHDNLAGLEVILNTQRLIEECITTGALAIINCDDISYEALKGLLVALKVMKYDGKITIIKTNLSEALHYDYWMRNRNKSRYRWNKLKKERVSFSRILEDKTFNDERVCSIEVTNPSNVRFEIRFKHEES